METPGSIIDKLCTVNNKMFFNQELIYEIRKMSYDEFLSAYDMQCSDKSMKLYKGLHACCDLNVQRNKLIFELDQMLEKMVKEPIQAIDPHKTY